MAIDPKSVLSRANELARIWVPYAPQWGTHQEDAPAVHALMTAICEAIDAELAPILERLNALDR